MSVVTISYGELTAPILQPLCEKIGAAFGDSATSLGILAISDVPGFSELRQHLLPLSRRLASLSPEELCGVTVESAGYQVGWSHGKEKVEGDKFDVSKGSYYANPLVEDLLQSIIERRRVARSTDSNSGGMEEYEAPEDDLERVSLANPAFFAQNVWPTESIPELEAAIKDMGRLICKVGRLLAKLCDKYVSTKCPGYTKGKLESILTTSLCCKARLLHYFPAEADFEKKQDLDKSPGDDSDFSDWCGWHNDHGSLTGLVPAMYLDSSGTEMPCPDPSAGLYIKSRGGDVVHINIPTDCLAFQVGETSQIHTGGLLQATPHAVRGCRPGMPKGGEREKRDITREAFAVFMEPEYHGDMLIPGGRTVVDAQTKESEKHLPQTIRTLRSRWRPGMNFGEFSNSTFAAFH